MSQTSKPESVSNEDPAIPQEVISEDIWNKLLSIQFTITDEWHRREYGFKEQEFVNAMSFLSFARDRALYFFTNMQNTHTLRVSFEDWNHYWKDLAIAKLKKIHASLLQSMCVDGGHLFDNDNILSCYKWQLPRLKPFQIEILCSEFTRLIQKHSFLLKSLS